jgi:hypothetical protein
MFPERQQTPNGRRNPLFSIHRPRQNINPIDHSAWNTVNQTNTGASGFSKALDNIQQVLKTIESGVPIVQEYAPMIKNLPAMYNMMKAFNDSEETPDESTEESNNENQEKNQSEKKEDEREKVTNPPTLETKKEFDKETDEEKKETKEETREKIKKTNGKSVPKLFI